MKAKNWNVTNRRRGALIDKKVAKTITADESRELEDLQEYAGRYLRRVAPIPTAGLEYLEATLRKLQEPTE